MKFDIITMFNENKKFRIALYIISGAIVLIIFLSGFFEKDTTKTTEKVAVEAPTKEYVSELEHRVSELVSSIKGVGRSKVMITLESGVEKVFATEANEDINRLTNSTSDSTRKEERQEIQKKYIVIQNGDGSEDVLVQTTLEPKIRGVVIVCDGGDNASIVARITEAVSVALDLDYNRIYVTKMTN